MAPLCQCQDEFKRLNTEVLIIAFGTLPLAQAWIVRLAYRSHDAADRPTVERLFAVLRQLTRKDET